MCTVTFIPFQDKVFITSNRDESPSRGARGLISFHAPEKNIIHYPLDETSGGSWIALSDSGRAVCLLNGGFEPYVPDPPYRQSRGLVVKDAISEEHVEDFLNQYQMENIAPFTLLIFEDNTLHQLVWDGNQKNHSILPVDQPQIWSSVTLYSPSVRTWRKSLFEKWLAENAVYDRERIIRFHQMSPGDADNDFIMNRDEIVKTLSITSIILQSSSASIMHMELDNALREEIVVKHE